VLDELGGVPILFSKHRSQGPAASDSFTHKGKFSDLTVPVGRSVTVQCPASNRARGANVIVLELYALSSGGDYLEAVGWTAIPLLDNSGTTVRG